MRVEKRSSLSMKTRVAAALLSCCALISCKHDNIGTPCSQSPDAVGEEIIQGETPVVEVKRLTRDGACSTLLCLAQGGFAPFCTDRCDIHPPAVCLNDLGQDKCPGKQCINGACVDNPCYVAGIPQCPNKTCIDGQCVDHNCPDGFRCDQLQEVGPLKDERVCHRVTECRDKFDCGDVASLDCVQLGCYDRCLAEVEPPPGQEACPFHQLACSDVAQMTNANICTCSGDLETCQVLSCNPPWGTEPWPDGSVTREDVCLPKNPGSRNRALLETRFNP